MSVYVAEYIKRGMCYFVTNDASDGVMGQFSEGIETLL